ncbi:MAG: hypothetical protein ETSY2_39145, partial [Candidatus Entotheonella gemina]
KVGVIGLSVGQSVAVTIAQERSCGELRLCDFDVLELSNYNRIRTRLTHLGLRKTVSVAREIKELDPFFKVVCFHDGLTPDNMDEFFLGGGTLDVCIDECDDVAMKILSRIKAKKLRVPVVMEASDNCTVDVERFDLEPERPLLHGYIDHLDVEKAAQLKTNEEKVPYMLAMLAPELMTNKMLASIFEINETITTWPQLASSIVYGGGICANVCRRVLLNTFTESGRHQLNVDAYFGDKSSPQKEWTGFQTPKRISEHEMSQVTAKFAPQQGAPSLRSDLEILIKSAAQAPSGGNAQPWLWHYHEQKGIFQFVDQSQQTPLLDCAFIASLIGHGAASENLVLAAKSKGIDLKAVFHGQELSQDNHLIAHYEGCDAASAHPFPELAQQIASRITNRKNGDRTVLPASTLEWLQQVGETVEDCTLHFITDENKLDEFAQMFAQIEMARITDTQGHEDFMHEIRWSEQEEKEKGDGVNIWSLDIDDSDYVGMLACKQLGALQMLREWGKGTKLTRLFRKTIDSCSALGVICLPGTSNEDFFKAGRALQRVWLKATELGLAFQPQSPMTLLFYHIANIKNSTMDVQTRQTVQAVQKKYAQVFDMIGTKQGLFVFRLSSTEKKGVPSCRRTLDEVLSVAVST